MNSFGIDICEVCGSQSADHSGWFAVAGNGTKMEVLPWTDDLRQRKDFRSACCGDHVEKLVIAAATHDLTGATFLSTTRRAWDPQALVPTSAKEESDEIDEALANILSAVDSILHGSRSEEDEAPAGFDA